MGFLGPCEDVQAVLGHRFRSSNLQKLRRCVKVELWQRASASQIHRDIGPKCDKIQHGHRILYKDYTAGPAGAPS